MTDRKLVTRREFVKTAGSGRRGDGLVFVTPVERAVKIRTGREGPGALSP